MLTLSTMLSAVKPSERSDQYAILAALYSLNAHTASVTAKQVTDLLRLHLGGKAPGNVNASLRAYGAYVEPAEKGHRCAGCLRRRVSSNFGQRVAWLW